MCEFISWVEYGGRNYFLTKKDLSTDRGKELIEYCSNDDDLVGHGAVREYYGFTGGLSKECDDFTNPNRFPPEIVQALKDGLFEGMGVAPEILTKVAREKYDKVRQQAAEEYQKIEQRGYEKYREVERQVWKERRKTRQRVWKGYSKAEQQAWEKYNKMTRQAQEECRKVAQQAFWALFKDPNNRTEVWR